MGANPTSGGLGMHRAGVPGRGIMAQGCKEMASVVSARLFLEDAQLPPRSSWLFLRDSCRLRGWVFATPQEVTSSTSTTMGKADGAGAGGRMGLHGCQAGLCFLHDTRPLEAPLLLCASVSPSRWELCMKGRSTGSGLRH